MCRSDQSKENWDGKSVPRISIMLGTEKGREESILDTERRKNAKDK